MAIIINIKEKVLNWVYSKTEIDDKIQDIGKALDAKDSITSVNEKINGVNSTITTTKAELQADINTKATQTDLNNKVSKINSDLDGKSDVGHDHTYLTIHNSTNTETLADKLSSIDSAIGSLQSADWDIAIVTELPNADEAVAGRLYFLHDENETASGNGNAFDEYIYDATNERFERLGQRRINLSNYVTDINMEISDAGVLTVSLEKGTSTQAL